MGAMTAVAPASRSVAPTLADYALGAACGWETLLQLLFKANGRAPWIGAAPMVEFAVFCKELGRIAGPR